MSTDTCLEEARDGRPEKAAKNSRQQRQQNMQERRQPMQAVPDEDAEERANVKLAFGPDVEKAGAKPQRHAKSEEYIWRRGDQGVGKRVRIDKRALEQGIERLQWIGATEGDRQAGHD